MIRRPARSVVLVVAGAALFLALRVAGMQTGNDPVRFHPDERHYAAWPRS